MFVNLSHRVKIFIGLAPVQYSCDPNNEMVENSPDAKWSRFRMAEMHM